MAQAQAKVIPANGITKTKNSRGIGEYLITLDGDTMTINEWAHELMLDAQLIRNRISSGVTDVYHVLHKGRLPKYRN